MAEGDAPRKLFNSLDAYADAGAKAGRASRNHDQSWVRFEMDWLSRALGYEAKENRPIARAAFNDAYRLAAS